MKADLDLKVKEIEKEKQREVMLKDEETQKLLSEKEEEGRLALEEMELRLTALSTGGDAKSKLLHDLESRIQGINSEKKDLEVKLADISKRMKKQELEFKQEEKSHSIIMEQKVSDLNKDLKAKEANFQDAQSQLKLLSEEHNKLINEKQKVDITKNELQDEINKYKLDYEKIQDAHIKATDDVDQLKNNSDAQSSKILMMEQETEELKQKLVEKESDIVNAKKDYDLKLTALQDKLQNISQDACNESQKHVDSQLAILKEQHLEELQKIEAVNLELKKTLEESSKHLAAKEKIIVQENAKYEYQSGVNLKLETRLSELELSLKNANDNIDKNELVKKNLQEQIQAKDEQLLQLTVTSEQTNESLEKYREQNISIREELKNVQREMEIEQEHLKEVKTALAFANEDICKKSQLLEEKERSLICVENKTENGKIK